MVAHYLQMPPSKKTGTIMVADYPQMPPSEKMGTIVVAHYLQMPPSEKNGDNSGSTLSANAAVRKKRGQ
jgi:hypothetical protein